MKKLLCLFIICMAFPVFAQTDNPVSEAFQPLEVNNVRLRLDEENGIALVFNASPAVCDELLVDMRVDGHFIDIDVFAPMSDSECNFIAPYEPVISLADIETNQSYVLRLNAFNSTFFLPDSDDTTTVEAFLTIWGEDNILASFNRVAPMLDDIFVTTIGGLTTIELNGNHPDGCITDEYTRISQDAIQSNLYHVESFRLISEFVMCPAQLTPFHDVMSLELSTDDIVEIDGRFFSVANLFADTVLQDRATIDSVAILSTASGNIVVVEGLQTQDCGVEFTEYVTERKYISIIDIVAYVPLDADCTDGSVSYGENFTVANLPVVINGVAYDENGEIDPMVSAQSFLPAEGNFMPVDTVIESVEVLVLESFPMQLQLEITGYQPDGCELPVIVEQSTEDNTVSLHIYRDVPSDALCPMALVPFEETISIDGTFEGGTVTIEVNEFSTEIDL